MRTLLIIVLITVSFFQSQAQSIVGKWETYSEELKANVDIVYLSNGNFRVKWGAFMGYGDPTVGWGANHLENGKLTLQYFDGNRQEYQVSNLTRTGHTTKNIESGDQFQYKYVSGPVLEDWEKVRIVSENNFHRLTGMWDNGQEVLKFMGDGLMFAHLPSNNSSEWFFYKTNGNQLYLQEINKSDTEEYAFIVDLEDFTRQGFSFTSNNGRQTYKYKGAVKLTNNETFLYQSYLATIHRVNMSGIDMMDGVQDFIWKRVDKNGNAID